MVKSPVTGLGASRARPVPVQHGPGMGRLRLEGGCGRPACADGAANAQRKRFRSRSLMPNRTFGGSYLKVYPTMSAAAMNTPLVA